MKIMPYPFEFRELLLTDLLLNEFGFEWFDKFCENHSCKIKIINNDSLSPQEEMTKDLMSIIHCFSPKLYGLRKYKKEIMKLSNEKEI